MVYNDNYVAGMGAQQMASTSFGNPKNDMVYKMILGCQRDEGLSRDELVSQLKGKVNKPDVDSSIEFLSSEGHIYSTIDDDHFKTID
jgi:replication factor A2